jgi:hypothetical protein
MPNNPNHLTVRAAFPNRTYIGASFCSGETGLRDMYEGVSADKQTMANDVRTAAQTAADIEQVIRDISGLRHTQQAPLVRCLQTIFAGNCQVYPRTPTSTLDM